MTVYGDLDVSLLDEKPPGRVKVVTALREGAKQKDVTKFVKDQLEAQGDRRRKVAQEGLDQA